ncbi:MAG: hypothetical protein O9282_04815 [Flavobacterium sp.]|jgi:hypothetical protein|uniref:hypothetical protein n=1 Tax=Flavobacterium sp. TaxID=239 RepID=UPI0022C0FB9B|nr:hypothetical protein [Flavobacterium sp.]MCZ8330615.1 hypothetical protein [Flavobacterium sp.]
MKTLFLSMLLVTSITLNAQITKGNWMVGGTGSYYNNKAESGSSVSEGTGLNLSADIGYFPVNKFAIGLAPSIGYSKTKGNRNSNEGFGMGIFGRYYFLKPENQINVFSHLEYYTFNNYSGGDKTSNNNGFIIKAGPIIYFNSSVGFELTLNYENSKINSVNGTDTTFKNFNIGVGFQIHLEK